MYEFARVRQAGSLPHGEIEVAFLAMARPLLGERLQEIAPRRYGRVIVQPHLLFHGELVESIGNQVAEAALRWPETEWIVTEPLADRPGKVTRASELLEKVILDRCSEAGIHVVGTDRDD